MAEWGPYKKVGELTREDIAFVETHIAKGSITWEQYEEYTKNGCPDH